MYACTHACMPDRRLEAPLAGAHPFTRAKLTTWLALIVVWLSTLAWPSMWSSSQRTRPCSVTSSPAGTWQTGGGDGGRRGGDGGDGAGDGGGGQLGASGGTEGDRGGVGGGGVEGSGGGPSGHGGSIGSHGGKPGPGAGHAVKGPKPQKRQSSPAPPALHPMPGHAAGS